MLSLIFVVRSQCEQQWRGFREDWVIGRWLWRWNGGGFLSGGWVDDGGKQCGLKLHGLMEMIIQHVF